MNNYWQTPNYILDLVNIFYDNDYFDPCPINPTFDGLSLDCNWTKKAFVNPPYSRGEIEKWTTKALYENHVNKTEIIFLINYGCSKNRNDIIKKSSAFGHIYNGRIFFVNPKTGKQSKRNDRDSALYYIGTEPKRFKQIFTVENKIKVALF